MTTERKLPFRSAFIRTVRGADLVEGMYLFEGGIVGGRIEGVQAAPGLTVEVVLDDGTERRFLPFEQVRVAVEHVPEQQIASETTDNESEAS